MLGILYFKYMKKYTLLLLLIPLIAFVACNNEESKIKEYQSTEANYVRGDTLTITGQLIDSHCYALDKENTGHNHNLPESGYREDCAEYCALQGYPVGVLIKDEQDQNTEEMWVIMTAAQIFADYMTQTVRVQGTVRTDGILDPLQVELKTGPNEWTTIM